MLYRMTCVLGFRDGMVYPRPIRPGEVVEVDEATFKKMQQSDPRAFEYSVAQRVIPPSSVQQEPVATEKEAGDA